MNIIFKRNKPIVVDIPPRPKHLPVWRMRPYRDDYRIKKPVLSGGKIFYPIGYECSSASDYFSTKKKAEAACKKLNVPIDLYNSEAIKHNELLIVTNNKEIAEWDAKYGDKKL